MVKRGLRGDLTTVPNSQKGSGSQLGVGLFSQVTRDRKRHSLKLYQGELRLDIRNYFFTEKVIIYWNGVPQGGGGVMSLEVLKERLDVALEPDRLYDSLF